MPSFRSPLNSKLTHNAKHTDIQIRDNLFLDCEILKLFFYALSPIQIPKNSPVEYRFFFL